MCDRTRGVCPVALLSTPSRRAARTHRGKRRVHAFGPLPLDRKTSGPCPGYVIDHVPLKRGSADDPTNMQGQTAEQAKAKDRTE